MGKVNPFLLWEMWILTSKYRSTGCNFLFVWWFWQKKTEWNIKSNFELHLPSKTTLLSTPLKTIIKMTKSIHFTTLTHVFLFFRNSIFNEKQKFSSLLQIQWQSHTCSTENCNYLWKLRWDLCHNLFPTMLRGKDWAQICIAQAFSYHSILFIGSYKHHNSIIYFYFF